MNKILKELNLPGSTTKSVLVKRKSSPISNLNRQLELQLEVKISDNKSDFNKNKE
ncbi:hypothetical protein [Metabacillus fastidiosus]|uniref:hypothetical protein n=1 Tax=Metabacillus fastidiosus TaxID=1458 RepID=UPI002DB88557|nr:hypothetical protein [Metabacillus fastidiosus]MEC2076104.1 hypothetical protein [Metabacillus fastidiosus]